MIALMMIAHAALAQPVSLVCRQGQTCRSARFLGNAGSVTAPTFSTGGDLDTGIYFPSAGTMSVGQNGAEALHIDASGRARFTSNITLPSGNRICIDGPNPPSDTWACSHGFFYDGANLAYDDKVFFWVETATKIPLTLAGAASQSASLQVWETSAGVDVATMSPAGAYRMVGVATASLPACAAGIAGTIQYDTTDAVVKFCNGSSWLAIGYGTNGNYYSNFAAYCDASPCAEGTTFLGAYTPPAEVTAHNVTCVWGTAGTAGTTGVVAALWDDTGNAEVCTCTLGACTASANESLTCACASSMTPTKRYSVRLSATTDCDVNPSNIMCSVGYRN